MVASVVMAERRKRILKWVGKRIPIVSSNEQTSQLVCIKEEIGIEPTRGLIKREKGELRTDRLRDSSAIETGTDDGYHSACSASSLIGLTFPSVWRPCTPPGVLFSVTFVCPGGSGSPPLCRLWYPSRQFPTLCLVGDGSR